MSRYGYYNDEEKMISTSDVYFGNLLQVKNGILAKSEIKFAVVPKKENLFSPTKYIAYPGEFEVFLPNEREYSKSISIKMEDIDLRTKIDRAIYPAQSKISMGKNHIITIEDEGLSFLSNYIKLNNVLGEKKITKDEIMTYVVRNNDVEKLKEFDKVMKHGEPERGVNPEREEILKISKDIDNTRSIATGVKKVVFTAFFGVAIVTLGMGGYNLYKNNQGGKFKYEFDADGNLLANGNIKYDVVKNWSLVEKEMVNGEHKLFITSTNVNGDLIDVLKDIKVGSNKTLNDTDEFGIVNVKGLENYLLAYDMVKAYYTSDDIKDLLSMIEQDYQYNNTKELEK